MVKSIGVKQSMKVDKQSEASGANKSPEKIAKQPSSSESLGRSDSRGSGLTVIKNVRRIKSGLAGKEVLEIVVHKSPSNEKFDSCPIMNRSKSNENKLQNNVEKIDGIEQQKVDQGKIDSSLEEFKSALGRQSLQPETSSSNDELVEKLENIDNLGSEISLGFGETIGDLEDRSQTLIIREGPEPYLSILGTVCAYAILCPHGKIPLQKLKNRGGFWLPFVYAKESQKYSRSISLLYEFFVDEFKSPAADSSSDLDLLKSSEFQNSNSEIEESLKLDKKDIDGTFLSQVQLYNIYRLQIPDGQFVSRYIFLANWSLKDNPHKIQCCKDTANIQWHLLDSIGQNVRQVLDRVWGYEVAQCVVSLQQLQKSGAKNFKAPQIQEFTCSEVLKYISRYSSSRSPSSSLFTGLLNDAKFSERDVIKIFCDYIQHCYPSTNMTFCSFNDYFNRIGLGTGEEASMRNIFRALNYKNKNFILFNEFLLGLAALDVATPNSQLRCTYLFRYYDRSSVGYLEQEDFKQIMLDIREKTNLSTDLAEVNADVKNKLQTLKLLDEKKRIMYEVFVREILNGRLQGTQHLFRVGKPVLETIHTRHAYEFISNKIGKPFGPRLVGTCPKCRPKKYSLAYHTVKLNNQGHIDDPQPLITRDCGELDADLHFKKKANEMELKHSIDIVFNDTSVANRVLNIVRKLQDFNKLPRERQKEVSNIVVNQLTAEMIYQLCKEASEIFVIEPRVVKVNTPCLVMGDLHGNINDLLTYEEQLWPLAPSANAANVLFLGDYVDRGDYSIEVISYLFAMKILAPTKFFLLRGNHEIRSIQKNFTFARECMMKYSYQAGQKVFEAFNNAFDNLPLVGIIDESIFCAHGGIPYSASKIEDLYKIPMPMPDPEYQSKAAWEVLWSDPVTDEEFTQVCQFKNESTELGFTDNLRRSTAYYFTEKALRNFLKTNNLSHVIRAHELELEGYRFHHSGLLITVFSSSRYCNSQNKSAAVFVDGRENDGFIKVIALET